jgi:hypothetical protein
MTYDQHDPGEPRRLGIVRLTRDQLRRALGLPEGTTIIAISTDLFFLTDGIAVKVEHNGLPLTKPGHPISIVEPQFRTKVTSVEEAEFERWG